MDMPIIQVIGSILGYLYTPTKSMSELFKRRHHGLPLARRFMGRRNNSTWTPRVGK